MSLNFNEILTSANQNLLNILTTIYPNGKVQGKEFVLGSVHGEPGKSFKINLKTGKGKDFSTGFFGDLIAILAELNNVSMLHAAKDLAERFSLVGSHTGAKAGDSIKKTEQTMDLQNPLQIDLPPIGNPLPNFFCKYNGFPKKVFCYRTLVGRPMFYIARYENSEGKTMRPFSYSYKKNSWVRKGWPGKKPMYRQEKLTVLKDGFVLIVEGERCAEDAQQIIGNTGTAITWPFGAASTGQVDWTPLYGRKIIIWPDNDSDGLKAAEAIFELLELHVPEINILNVSDKPNKWDASDALAEGYSLDLEDITLNQPNLLKEKL